jgi:hypothetical protein
MARLKRRSGPTWPGSGIFDLVTHRLSPPDWPVLVLVLGIASECEEAVLTRGSGAPLVPIHPASFERRSLILCQLP